MTPEGLMKRRIAAVLGKYRPGIYVHMPVPGGFGRSTLDYIGIIKGLAFAIEAKKEGGKPTDRQQTIIDQMRAAGARVFIVNSTASLEDLDRWLALITES